MDQSVEIANGRPINQLQSDCLIYDSEKEVGHFHSQLDRRMANDNRVNRLIITDSMLSRIVIPYV